MISGEGIADLSPFAQAYDGSADLEWISIVTAAHILTQVAANRSSITDLGRGDGASGLNKGLTTPFQERRLNDVGELR